ncbi:MAG: YciI family protein [Croceibacterium sp.]
MTDTGQPVHRWLLTYTLAPDYLARRAALRAEHLALAAAAAGRGDLLLGGAVYDGEGAAPEEALLLFADAAAAEAFARSDPYVTHGLVTRWRVREWATVAGIWAE